MHTILLVLALVLAILAGLNIGAPRVNLGWFALAAFVASFLI